MRGCVVRLQRLNVEELTRKTDASTLSLSNYCLRNRGVKKEEIARSDQVKTTLAVARKQTQTALAAKYWNAARKHTTSSSALPRVGEVVLAKMRTYRPWPAIVLNDEKKMVFWVRFLGKGSEGSVKKNECVLFANAIECVHEYSKFPVDDYRRAVREAELFLSIPAHASILRNV